MPRPSSPYPGRSQPTFLGDGPTALAVEADKVSSAHVAATFLGSEAYLKLPSKLGLRVQGFLVYSSSLFGLLGNQRAHLHRQAAKGPLSRCEPSAVDPVVFHKGRPSKDHLDGLEVVELTGFNDMLKNLPP